MGFEDYMIDDGFDDAQEYMEHLESRVWNDDGYFYDKQDQYKDYIDDEGDNGEDEIYLNTLFEDLFTFYGNFEVALINGFRGDLKEMKDNFKLIKFGYQTTYAEGAILLPEITEEGFDKIYNRIFNLENEGVDIMEKIVQEGKNCYFELQENLDTNDFKI